MPAFCIERMTQRADAFFEEEAWLPYERYCTVTLKDGSVSGGHCFYRNVTGTWGVYFKVANLGDLDWYDDETMFQCALFPFEYLGARVVISSCSSALVRSYLTKIGAKFTDPINGVSEFYVTYNSVLEAKAKCLGGQNE